MRFAFRRAATATVEVELDDRECVLLLGLLAQLGELVASDEPGADGSHADDPLAAMVGIGTSTHLPLDPAQARLFPDAYHDDAIAAGDFRRYTELRLRDRKARHAATMSASLRRLSPIALDDEEVASWLGSLNDLRLVFGTLLAVDEEDDLDERLGEPDGDTYGVYLWLTQLQGALLEALAVDPG